MEKELNLAKLYDSIETLKEIKDVDVPEKLYKLLSFLEEQYLREKVIPVLSGQIEPMLSQIRREFILVMGYHPDKPITVFLSRSNDPNDAILLTSAPVPPPSPITRLRVTMGDGRVFCDEKNATNTFCQVLDHIGLARVRELGITSGPLNLVSTSPDPHRQQRRVGDYYILTNSSTQAKADQLGKISDLLHLGLKVEVI